MQDTAADVNRQLYYADNLPVLWSLASESVDLVYLDPPFNSDRAYNIIHPGDLGQVTAFEDTWYWDVHLRELAQQSGLIAPEQEGLYPAEPFAQLQILTLKKILTGQLPAGYAVAAPASIKGCVFPVILHGFPLQPASAHHFTRGDFSMARRDCEAHP